MGDTHKKPASGDEMSAMTLEQVLDYLKKRTVSPQSFMTPVDAELNRRAIACLTTHAQTVEKVREVIGEMEEYGEWSFAQMLRKAIGDAK